MHERHWTPPGRRAIRLFRAAGLLVLTLGLSGAGGEATAHPHVWVTARAQFVFDGDNLAAIRHSWTFDPAYSQFATQGLDTDGNGKLDAAELADLARDNVDGLLEFDFFTKARANGKQLAFTRAKEPSMDYTDGALTLHFTLPLDPPVPAGKVLATEIYDPTYFVSFLFAPGDNAATVDGRDAPCAVTLKRPAQQVFADDEDLSEAFFNALTAAAASGHDFATRAIIACP